MMMMMMRSCVLVASILAVVNAAPLRVFTTTLVPIPGTPTAGRSGRVTVFITDTDTVAYAGFATGLDPFLHPSNCTALNGCGAHVHSGFGCADATVQEGHFFEAPVTVDPWEEDRYSTDGSGRARFAGIVTTGSTDIQGRAFIVHGETGDRLLCGTLNEVVPDPTRVFDKIYMASTTALGPSGVTAEVTALTSTGGTGRVCLYGKAMGLEVNLTSYLDGGSDCDVANGCGAHFHEGTGCAADEQLGHYYGGSVTVDPWMDVGYLSTDMMGNGEFIECLNTGVTDFDGRAFIVHDSTGARVSCGLLMREVGPTDMPTSVPTMAPVTMSPVMANPLPTPQPVATAAPTTETVPPGTTRAPTTSVPTRAPSVPQTPDDPTDPTDPTTPSEGSGAHHRRLGLSAALLALVGLWAIS